MEMLLEPKHRSSALSFGSSVHEALAAWYEPTLWRDARLNPREVHPSIRDEWEERKLRALSAFEKKAYELRLTESIEDGGKRSIERGIEILTAYFDDKYPYEDFIVENVELPFICEVTDLDPPFIYGGTIDGLIRKQGKLGGMEHKTVSRLDRSYLESFRPNHQVTGYCYALSEYVSEPVFGFLLNLVHVVKEKTTFIRLETKRTPEEIQGFKRQIIEIVKEIRRCRESGVWTQNAPEACKAYGGCSYSVLCNVESRYFQNFVDFNYTREIPGDMTFMEKLSDPTEVDRMLEQGLRGLK